MSDLLFHDDVETMFKPLATYVRTMEPMNDHIFDLYMAAYMYMHHLADGQHAYKHVDTREYVYINQDGTLRRGLVQMPIEID